MTEEEVIDIANAYVAITLGEQPKLIGVGKSPGHSSEWDVLFEATTPEGAVLEGAIVVIVDERTKRARLLSGPL